MKTALVVLMVAALPASSFAGSGDLAASIRRAVAEEAQQAPKPIGGFRSEKQIWAGAFLLSIGGTIALASATVAADELITCTRTCVSERLVNKGGLAVGLGTVAVGGVLLALGLKPRRASPAIVVAPGRVQVVKRFEF